MASLVLLLSELLRHKNPDNLISSPPPPPATTTPSSATRRNARKCTGCSPSNCKTYAQDQLQEDLPRASDNARAILLLPELIKQN
ncbi:hypothetical protein BUALT_Bualt18G0111500 [Buddleja alternifolia]|uniref:Uncharacterized protein n=1 Tax=Buddleja alternifolia TaxID=168488 RepID=A0AAV6WEX8_9LAMI|nr:hypothetical protein BUALT_Bualt18G0111500 [Buddleja alternifolia]